MELEDFYKFFNDITKIYAIGSDLDLSDDKMRLLSFIHIKVSQNSIEYFEKPKIEEIQALQIMLGDIGLTTKLLQESDLCEEQKENVNVTIENFTSLITKIDHQLTEHYGLENRLTSELKHRLQLYTNSNFRKNMLDLYKNQIKPQLSLYTEEKIQESFINYHKRTQKREQELNRMLKNI